MKIRKFQVLVTVEVNDPYEGDPDMEHAIVARAMAASAKLLARAPEPRKVRGLEVKEVT